MKECPKLTYLPEKAAVAMGVNPAVPRRVRRESEVHALRTPTLCPRRSLRRVWDTEREQEEMTHNTLTVTSEE